MNEQKTKVLVTGGTKSDVAPMAVFAMNVKKTNGHLFDKMVIFHDGIRKKDQILINSIFPTEFILYEPNFESKNDVVLTYFSKMVFCKYECFRLLDDYDVVVWSDYDVVIYDKLDELCINSGCAMKGVFNEDLSLRTEFYKEISNKEIYKYDLMVPRFTAPLIVLFRDLYRHKEIYDFCNKKTIEYQEDIFFPEQCVMALALQEFDIAVEKLDLKTYVCLPSEYKEEDGIKIIHAMGQCKFWNGLYNDTWNTYYTDWINMGGSKYSERRKQLLKKVALVKARMKGVRAREAWNGKD